jgi:hypothetical protein
VDELARGGELRDARAGEMSEEAIDVGHAGAPSTRPNEAKRLIRRILKI